jgi:hypothetical protein
LIIHSSYAKQHPFLYILIARHLIVKNNRYFPKLA